MAPGAARNSGEQLVPGLVLILVPALVPARAGTGDGTHLARTDEFAARDQSV